METARQFLQQTVGNNVGILSHVGTHCSTIFFSRSPPSFSYFATQVTQIINTFSYSTSSYRIQSSAMANAKVSPSHYDYDPSLPTAIVAASLYTLFFVATFILWLRYRAWVWVVMVLASGMESAGYIARCLSTQHSKNDTLYILQFLLVVLAPVLMAGACYVIFVSQTSRYSTGFNYCLQGRIVYHVVPTEARTTRLLWISPRWLTPIFVVCDVGKLNSTPDHISLANKFTIVALFLQLIGAVKITSITSATKDPISQANKGKHIAEIGVAVQLICFGLFSIIAVRFNFTSKRFSGGFNERFAGDGKNFLLDDSTRKYKRNWQTILRVTNLASALILVCWNLMPERLRN